MNKIMLIAAFVLAAPLAFAEGNKKKLVIKWTPNGGAESDCKFSAKEIKSALKEPGENPVCTDFDGVTGEATPQDLNKFVKAAIANEGQLVATFEAAEATKITEILTGWIKYLEMIKAIAAGEWVVAEKGVVADKANYVFTSSTGEAFELSFTLNVPVED